MFGLLPFSSMCYDIVRITFLSRLSRPPQMKVQVHALPEAAASEASQPLHLYSNRSFRARTLLFHQRMAQTVESALDRCPSPSGCRSSFLIVSKVQDERCLPEETGCQKAGRRVEPRKGRQGRELTLDSAGVVGLDSLRVSWLSGCVCVFSVFALAWTRGFARLPGFAPFFHGVCYLLLPHFLFRLGTQDDYRVHHMRPLYPRSARPCLRS